MPILRKTNDLHTSSIIIDLGRTAAAPRRGTRSPRRLQAANHAQRHGSA